MRSSAESDNYDIREAKDLTINRLKHLFDSGLYNNVIQYMRNFKTRIVLTPDDVYDHRSPNLAWKAGTTHKLDYICAIGNKIGLHAALTNAPVNAGYEFELKPRPSKQFSGKYAQLGFDQVSSLLYIGSRPGEEVFLCMAPTETLSPLFDSPPSIGLCTGPTNLSPKHARILIIFLSHCLSLMPDAKGVYCINPYSIKMPPEPMDWDFTSALYVFIGSSWLDFLP